MIFKRKNKEKKDEQNVRNEFGKENTFDQINYSDRKKNERNRLSNINVESGEELAKKNNSNDERSAHLKTNARNDNNQKKDNRNVEFGEELKFEPDGLNNRPKNTYDTGVDKDAYSVKHKQNHEFSDDPNFYNKKDNNKENRKC